MKLINNVLLLLFTGLLMSCGGGSTSVDTADKSVKETAKAVKEAAENVIPAANEKVREATINLSPKEQKEREVKADPKGGSEYNAPYICVDHCKNSGSAAAGKCRTCKKDYIKNVNYKKVKAPGY